MSKDKHPEWNKVISVTPEFMAETMGNLKYDELAEFLSLLAAKIAADGEKDTARGRKKLGEALAGAAGHIEKGADEIDRAWKICEPYMK